VERKRQQAQKEENIRVEVEAQWNKKEEKMKRKQDIPRSSTNIPLIRGHFPLGELGLGFYTPSKARKVANLNSFRFAKKLGKIIVQKIKKLPSNNGDMVIENIKNDPLSITSADVAFNHQRKTQGI
jgi:hypothetical protein